MKQRLVMGVAVVVVVILGLTWTTAQDSAQTARIWDADYHDFIA